MSDNIRVIQDRCHVHDSTVVSLRLQEPWAPMSETWTSSDRYNSTIVNVAPTTDLEERVSRLEEILATTRRPQ